MNFKNHCYHCKSGLLPGNRYADVSKIARRLFREIESQTRRRAYIRCAYFNGDKVFFDNFWVHLNQKNPCERKKRLQYFVCAIELIKKSKNSPIYKAIDKLKNQALYRFVGQVGCRFFIVQIKEDLRRKQKFFMSVFEHE
jgi:hypothetical protein